MSKVEPRIVASNAEIPRRANEEFKHVNLAALDQVLNENPPSTPAGSSFPPPSADHQPAPAATYTAAPPAVLPEAPSRDAAGRWPGWSSLSTLLSTRQLSPVAVLAVLAAGEAIALVALLMSGFSGAGTNGTLIIDTQPSGLRVAVDSVERGVTPVRLSIPAGTHRVDVQQGNQQRTIETEVTKGATASYHLEFAAAPMAAATGGIEVRTDPPGATVAIDGRAAGPTPVRVSDLTPGSHDLVINSTAGPIRSKVIIEAGRTVSLVVPLRQANQGAASGWIAVSSPFEVSLMEGGRVLGTSRSDRIMVPAGRHSVTLVNERLGFRQNRSVEVAAGKVAQIRAETPEGVVNVNALPWAELWIDGRRIGETPIANLNVPIGEHEFVFKHPSLGERQQRVTVAVGDPVRVTMDLTR